MRLGCRTPLTPSRMCRRSLFSLPQPHLCQASLHMRSVADVALFLVADGPRLLRV